MQCTEVLLRTCDPLLAGFRSGPQNHKSNPQGENAATERKLAKVTGAQGEILHFKADYSATLGRVEEGVQLRLRGPWSVREEGGHRAASKDEP